MILREQLIKDGNWLFKRRSYIPLLFLPVFAVGLSYPEARVSGVTASCWLAAGLMVSFAGFVIRAITVGCTPKGTSGRNTKEQVAEVLNTTGIYSTVRHPLYLGNALMGLGVALSVRVWWLALIYVLLFWLYYERIMYAEEAYLESKFGDEFREWAARTPAFIPNLAGRRPAALPFSFRNVLKREYTGFYVIVATFTLVHFMRDGLAHGFWGLDPFWRYFLAAGTFIYLAFFILEKSTRWFQVEGR